MGVFVQAGGMVADNIAEWNLSTSTWSSLGTGDANGTTERVYAIAILGTDVYVGGDFGFAGWSWRPMPWRYGTRLSAPGQLSATAVFWA